MYYKVQYIYMYMNMKTINWNKLFSYNVVQNKFHWTVYEIFFLFSNYSIIFMVVYVLLRNDQVKIALKYSVQ